MAARRLLFTTTRKHPYLRLQALSPGSLLGSLLGGSPLGALVLLFSAPLLAGKGNVVKVRRHRVALSRRQLVRVHIQLVVIIVVVTAWCRARLRAPHRRDLCSCSSLCGGRLLAQPVLGAVRVAPHVPGVVEMVPATGRVTCHAGGGRPQTRLLRHGSRGRARLSMAGYGMSQPLQSWADEGDLVRRRSRAAVDSRN